MATKKTGVGVRTALPLLEARLAMSETGNAWMARQAVGDAVLILLRDRRLSRSALLEQLKAMAEGRVKEWTGVPAAAEKAMEFIRTPPERLPKASIRR